MKLQCLPFPAFRPQIQYTIIRNASIYLCNPRNGLATLSRPLQAPLHPLHLTCSRQALNDHISLTRRCSPSSTLLNTSQTTHRSFSTTPSLSLTPMDQHDQTVQEISSAVASFYARKEPFRINHGSTNSTRHKSHKNLINTSTLSHILSISPSSKTCLVEPNVPMDRLVEATLAHNLIPPVVMEFPGITVGGGYSGTSGESSSFKHGFFDRTINKVEMVMGNGEVVNISPNGENGDLFNGAAGAVGTLGVTTCVELRLREARKFVETTYFPVKGMREAIVKLQEVTKEEGLDYVDGIMFSPTEGAIITGRLTDQIPKETPIQTFSHARDPWFYLHVQSTIRKTQTQPTIEAIPLAEYLFRYDRGGFWVGASAFKYFRFPFNRFTRWFLDDFLHTRMMYTALHASGQSKRYIVQDLALPYETAEEFVEYTTKEFGIWPLWLCPLKQSQHPTMHPHYAGKDEKGELKQMLNIGLWGDGPSNHSEFISKNRDLEKELRELKGMKWLYAHTYYSEEEFWEQFDRQWYEGLRKKYGAETLASVYEKVKVDVKKGEVGEKWWGKWPWSGFWGIWKAIESGGYKEARRSGWRYRG